MKKLISTIAGSVYLLLVFAATANANLIVNGSFELGDYDDSAHSGYMRLSPGATTIEGWVVGGQGLDWHIIEGSTAHFGRNGMDNSQYAVDLSLDYSPAGTIAQAFTTTPGLEYQLSFLLGVPGFNTAVKVSVADIVETFSLAAQSRYDFSWVAETLLFTATDVTTTLLFESAGGGYWGPVLDNVSVMATTSPVPEPSTLLLLTLGLIGAVVVRIKK